MSKYNNKKTEVDGHVFDSKVEAERWVYLVQRQASGAIRDLKRQERMEFPIHGEPLSFVKPKRKVTYRPDFTYWEKHTISGAVYWEPVVEDVKGYETDVWKIKWALAKACYPRTKFIAVRKKKDEWKEDIA